MTIDEFVKIWTAASSVEDVCSKTPYKNAHSVHSRAAEIRMMGIPLKHFYAQKRLTFRQMKELRRIAMSSNEKHRRTTFADWIRFVKDWQTASSVAQFCQRQGYGRPNSAMKQVSTLRKLGVPLKYFRLRSKGLNNAVLRELTRNARIEGTPAAVIVSAQARRIKQLEKLAESGRATAAVLANWRKIMKPGARA